MRKPSRWFLVAIAIMALAVGSQDLLAQQAGSVFGERFANVFAPESRTYYSLQTMQGQQFGGQQPYTGLGASHYLGSIDDAVTLFNGQLLINNNGNPAGTFGAQQRWMTVLPVLNTSILGAGLYFDFSQSRYDNLFQQANVNLELFTQSAWVGRVNGYFPMGQNHTATGPAVNQGAGAGQASLIGTTLYLGGISQQPTDVALIGSDFELGRKFFDYRMEAYGGYYNWSGPVAGFANGVKGGIRGFITDNLSGNVNVSNDPFFGTSVYGGVTFTFGGSGGRRPLSFQNLMTQPVQRSQQVAIGNFTRSVNTMVVAHDKATGNTLHTYFVQAGGSGIGTQADPSSIASVLANPDFGNGSTIVLLGNNGNITTPIVLTKDGQQVIGGEATGIANIDFSQALGAPPGTDVLHLTGLGGTPILAPTSGNAVTLTNNNTIAGFTIDGTGGLTGGIFGNPGSTGTLVNNMTIQNVSGTGVKIGPSTGTKVSNTTFSGNSTDIKLDAANTQITNVNSTGATNGAISLGVGGDITGNTLISNVTITGAGGFGGILLNNSQSGSTTTLSNIHISNGTGTSSGVTVTNSQSGSIYTMTNVNILNVGGNGYTLNSSSGTFNLGNVQVTNATGSGLSVTNSAAAVTAGTVTVNGAGTGLAFGTNTGGSFTATGATNLTNITGTGVDLRGATGTYNFANLNVGFSGAGKGLDFSNSNVLFTSNNTSITGDGTTAGSAAIDLSGSLNPNGTNSATANIKLADAAGQTATISGVSTGVLMGNVADGSAGSNFVYGNQTPKSSGSSISAFGYSLDSSHLTSTGPLVQGQYNFLGVGLTGNTTFPTLGATYLFVSENGLGSNSGKDPGNAMSAAQLITQDGTPSSLNNTTIVFVNDGNNVAMGASTLTLGNNTVLDTFGGGRNFGNGTIVPVNVNIDTLTGVTYSDPLGNGAATVTGTGTQVITLGNGDTVQNLTIDGGTSNIYGSSINGANINHNTLQNSSGYSVNLLTSMGSIQIQNNTITPTTTGGGISTTDNGVAPPLMLQLDNNTITSGSSLAMNIAGSALNSTIVTSMSDVTASSPWNAGAGGVLFNRVTFDASGAALSGTTVNAGNWNIGAQGGGALGGDGLRFNAPTGNLSFGTLNIYNTTDINHTKATGLYVDTTAATPHTTFNLSNTDGTIATQNGQAMYLDPLAVNLTFSSVSVNGSATTEAGATGMALTGVTGTVTVNGGTLGAGGPLGLAAINVDNSALTGTSSVTLNLNHMKVFGQSVSDGIFLNGQSSSVPIVLNLNSTQVIGGNGGGGGGGTSYGGGAGIQPTNATITLDANSTSTGGFGGKNNNAGGGAGIGGSGNGSSTLNSINFGTGVQIINNGTVAQTISRNTIVTGVTGGRGGDGGAGGGAGIGGGGDFAGGSGGGSGGASMSGSGKVNGGNGGNASINTATAGGGGGAGIGGGGGGASDSINPGSNGGSATGATLTGTGTATGGASGGASGGFGDGGSGAGVGGGGGGGGAASAGKPNAQRGGNGGSGNNATNSGTATAGSTITIFSQGGGGAGAGVGGGGGGGGSGKPAQAGTGGSGGSGNNATNSGTATGGGGGVPLGDGGGGVGGGAGGGGAGAGGGGGGGGQTTGSSGGTGTGAANTGTATGGTGGGGNAGNGSKAGNGGAGGT